LFTAEQLTTRLQQTLAALSAGRISYWQAHHLATGTSLLSEADARTVETQVLQRAPEQSAAETRRAVEKAVIAIEPEAAERRRKQRPRQRRVERPFPVGDGMSIVTIEGPTESLVGLYNLLTVWARQMKKAGHVDTVDAGRFDALMALILAAAAGPQPDAPSSPGPVPAHVDLLVNATTLAGADDQPAEIPGYGPITAHAARRIAFGLPEDDSDDDRDDDPDDSPGGGGGGGGPGPPGPAPPNPRPGHATSVTWSLLPVDPSTGWLARPDDPDLDRGRTTRFATPKQKRYIAARDRVGFMRGCNQPANRNDVDHRHDWTDDGRTDVDELGSGCPHHNRVTKNNGWTTIVGPNGTATLLSPLGRRYPITPYRYWD
jgi:hypothetical protein